MVLMMTLMMVMLMVPQHIPTSQNPTHIMLSLLSKPHRGGILTGGNMLVSHVDDAQDDRAYIQRR